MKGSPVNYYVGVVANVTRRDGSPANVLVYPAPYGFKVLDDKDGINVNDPLIDVLSIRGTFLKDAVTAFCENTATEHGLAKGKR